jgi:hypothetical protein
MEVMGLPILIEWVKFKPGTSFFIPCTDRRAIERFVRQEAKRLEFEVITKHVVENNILGLRVWRTEPTMPPHSSLG